MFWLLTIALILLSSNAQALNPMDTTHSHNISKTLNDYGFFSIIRESENSLGVNHFFTDSFLDKSIFIVNGLSKIDQVDKIVRTIDGHYFYFKYKSHYAGIFLHGFRKDEASKIIQKIKAVIERKYYTFKPLKLLIPSAHAGDCFAHTSAWKSLDSLEAKKTLANIGYKGLASQSLSCLKEIAGGIGNSVGSITDLASAIWNLSPSEILSTLKEKKDRFFQGITQLMKISLEGIGNFSSFISDDVKQLFMNLASALEEMSIEDKRKAICGFLGELGFDMALTFFSGGVAAPALILKAKKYIDKIVKIQENRNNNRNRNNRQRVSSVNIDKRYLTANERDPNTAEGKQYLNKLAFVENNLQYVLEKTGADTLFHGSTSSSLFGVIKQGKGLKPTGQLIKEGEIPLSGELRLGATSNGVNSNTISTTKITDLEVPVKGYLAGGRNNPGFNPENVKKQIENLKDFISNYPQANEYKEMLRIREAQLQKWNTISSQERNLVNDNFPVLYGIKPSNSRKIYTNKMEGRNATEVNIDGGSGTSEINSLFVPKSEISRVKKLLRASGNTNIQVYDIQPILDVNK